MVKRGAPLTFAMRDYLSLLKARHTTLLRQANRAASKALTHGRPVADPSLLRQVRAGVLDEDAPDLIEESALPDGTRSSSPDFIRDGLTRYVARLFASDVGREGDPTFHEALSSFVQGIATLSSEQREHLTSSATRDELRACVKKMNAASAPDPDGIPLSFYANFYETS